MSMFGRLTTFVSELVTTHRQQPCKMVLIGQTGSGKTSFLDLLLNCVVVQKLATSFTKDDLRGIQELNDPNFENPTVKGAMNSRTNRAKCYTLKMDDFELKVIDTPGFGDTIKGKEIDKENTKKIIDVLQEEHYLNCICLIVNGMDARMSPSLKHVLLQITPILPQAVLDNVVVVFTRVNHHSKLNFKPEMLATFFGREVKHMFCIENPIAIYQDSKGQELDRVVLRDMENAFEDVQSELQKMFKVFRAFPIVYTRECVILHAKKQEIEEVGSKLLTEYDNQRNIESQLEIAVDKVNHAATQASLSEQEFSAKKIIEKKTKDSNTICGAQGCNKNCHEGCWLPEKLNMSKHFRFCEAFIWGDQCKVCGHGAELHYCKKAKWVETKQGLVDADVKNKFENAKGEKEKAGVLRKGFEDQRQSVQTKKKRLCEELLKLIDEFQTVGVPSAHVLLLKENLALIKNRVHENEKSQDSDLLEVARKLEQRLKHVAQYL